MEGASAPPFRPTVTRLSLATEVQPGNGSSSTKTASSTINTPLKNEEQINNTTPVVSSTDATENHKPHTPGQSKRTPAFFKSSDIGIKFEDFLDMAKVSEKVSSMSNVVGLLSELKYEVDAESTNMVLSLLALFYRIYNLDSLTDLFITSLEFLKSVFGISAIIESAQTIYSFLDRHLANLYNKLLLVSTVKAESAIIDGLRNMRSNLNMILNSEIVTAIRDFVLSLVSFKVFDKDTASKITSFAGPARSASISELACICLDSVISTLNFSEQLYQGNSLTDIFCSKDPISSFLSEADNLDSISELTYSGLPVDGRMCRREYLAKVISVITDGEKLEQLTPTSSPQRRSIVMSLKKLKSLKSRFTLAMAAETRPAPKAVLIEGMPGVGKSVIIDIVSMVWSHVKGRQYDPSHVYHRQLEDYWSGYEPFSQPIIHLSEPGALHRSIAKSSGDPRMDEFLSLVDNQPYMCAMADLESKGKVYAVPELLVMDANDPTLNLDVIYNNPAAVRRRILYIKPTVKPEFLKAGTCRIDQVKSLASEAPRLDRWLFSVYTMEPVDIKKSAQVVHLSLVDIYELSDWLSKEFTQHITEQELRVGLTNEVEISDYLRSLGVKEDQEPPNPAVDAAVDAAFRTDICDVEEVDALMAESQPVLNLDDPEVQSLLRRAAEITQVNADKVKEAEEALEREAAYLAARSARNELAETIRAQDIALAEIEARRSASYKSKELLWKRLQVMKEVSYYLLFVIWDVLALGFFGLSFLVLWFWPQHLALKLSSLGFCKVKVEFRKDRFLRSWNLFKGSLGFANNFQGRPVPRYELVKYVTAFTAALVIVKTFSAATLWSEGALVSSSKVRTDEEISSDIRAIEKDVGTEMPQPRPCVGRSQDWDATIPTTVSTETNKACNESEKVRNSVRRNMREVYVSGTITMRTQVLGVLKDYALINRHSLATPSDGIWRLTVARDSSHTSGVSKVTVDPSQMTRITPDVYLIRLRGSKFSDITPYLPKDFITPRDFGTTGYIADTPTTVTASASVTANSPAYGGVVIQKPLVYPWAGHHVGACGTPLLVEMCGVTVVAGIHCAGDDRGKAYAESVNLVEIRKAIDKVSCSSGLLEIHSQGQLNLPTGMGLKAITARSPIRFESAPALDPVGGISGYNVSKPGKSSLRSTQFIHRAESLVGTSPFENGHPKFGAPRMGPSKNPDTGEYQAPPNNFVKKAGVVKQSLTPSTMKVVVNVVTEHIVQGLRARGVTNLAPVPLDVAQNGHPKDFYLRAMKPSTSAGFTFPGAKKKYSTPVSLPFKEEAYKPSSDVIEQVIETCEAYARQEDSHPIMGAQLKDEPRSFEKIKYAKTRVFCMSSYDSTLVNRLLLMPFYTLMVEHSDIFGAAIGINMHGLDVDEFTATMRDFSDQYMEGDYSGFDTSMPLDVGLMANSVVFNVLEAFGYNADALRAVTGVLSDNLYPLIALLGDLFTVPALQPSGKYATAEDNSLRGLILMVYAWVDMCTGESSNSDYTGPKTRAYTPEDFWTYVLPRIYGDDLLAAVKKEVSDYYNNNTYQQFCKEVYGIGYTNAQKTDIMQPYLSWHETSFLKRSFVYREDLGHWVAPLDLDSVMKSICYRLPSKVVSEDEQMIDSCTSALRELFFHLTEEEYAERRQSFAEACAEIYNKDTQRVLSVFPTFLAIKEQLYGEPVEEL